MKTKPILFEPANSPYLVPFNGAFRVAQSPTTPPEHHSKKKANRKALDAAVERLQDLQRKLYADDRYAVLLVFQAMDAAGKDGTIRAVMTGINPAGCQVFSFKQPSSEELDHDFLWRIYRRLPERGRIGIFNRSHYEETLVVRVHPEYLDNQKLPRLDSRTVWGERLEVQRQGSDALEPVDVPVSLGAWAQFVRVRSGKMANPCPPEAGLRFAKLMDMIRRSAKTGRTIAAGNR